MKNLPIISLIALSALFILMACAETPNPVVDNTEAEGDRNLPALVPTSSKIPTISSVNEQATEGVIPPLDRLVVCMAPVPVPLNPFADNTMSRTVLQAVNDGPVDFIRFQYYPVILETIPESQTGDVLIQDIAVHEGDLFFDPLFGGVRIYTGPETNMQQLVVRFQLRKGVNWSDGVPMTAFDSEYAYQLLAKSSPQLVEGWQPPSEIMFLQTANYRALDEYTVEWVGIPGLITTDYPKFFFPPLPSHLEVDLQTDWPKVGWGPYQIKEFTEDYLLVEANPNYFRADEGLPKIKEVEFRFLEPPYGQGHQPELISENECQILSAGISYYTSPKEWLEAGKQSNIQVISVPGNVGLQLVFNMDIERKGSAVHELNIRRAIASCIDRSRLAEEAGGVVADSYVHPLDPAYTPAITFDYNPELGRQMIEQSQMGAVGSSTSEIKVTLALYESIRWIGDAISDDLEKCGIAVEMETISNEDFSQPWPEGPIYGGKSDMMVFPLDAQQGLACNRYYSDNIPSPENPNGLNIARFNVSEFDSLCAQALSSLENEERTHLQREAQTLWGSSLPSIPLFWSNLITGVDCRVNGYQVDPSGFELWNLEEIRFNEACG